MRRVTVKSKLVLDKRRSGRALREHIRYIIRQGAGEDGKPPPLFCAENDHLDAGGATRQWHADHRHYRLMINPEDGCDLHDLRAFARRIMVKAQVDMGLPLEWVAAAHYDTGRPHLHVVVRGLGEDGKALQLPWDYLVQGLRDRCSEVVTEILGPGLGFEVLDRDIKADGFTQMDQMLIGRVRDGHLTLDGLSDTARRDAQRRLVHLESRGWVGREPQGGWSVPSDLRRTLQSVGEREAREAAAVKAVWGGAWGGQTDRLEPISLSSGEGLVGAYAGVRPIGWPYTGPQVLVLETMDGRLGHLRLARIDTALILDRVGEGAIIEIRAKSWSARRSDRTISEIAAESGGAYSADLHTAKRPQDRPVFIKRLIGRLEMMSREGACDPLAGGGYRIPDDYEARAVAVDGARHGPVDMEIRVLDARPLEQQVTARGITWLDSLISGLAAPPDQGAQAKRVQGFLQERVGVLETLGVGSGKPGTFSEADRRKLWTMEIEGQMQRLGKGRKLLTIAREGESFSGVFVDRAHMGGRTYAAIENRTTVTLAPWRAGLEACRNQALTGLVVGGVVDFRFGQRERISGLGA